MDAPTLDRPMAKPKAKPARNDVTVKIDAEAARVAKIVAAYRDKSLAEYLSEVVLPIARKDLASEQMKNPAKGGSK
jgi:hypothetical protein